jgi:hypothetical protein
MYPCRECRIVELEAEVESLRRQLSAPEPPDNIVILDCYTSLDIPADRVLEQAIGELDVVLVAGETPDGSLYFASSTPKEAKTVWLLEKMKQWAMS